ncbi:hypothetical protein TI39_contig623g00012 [Zymoseptoria brevis]|uniref:Uncharacterized protein n=1 Tax=Zymoseptoria brevis TaxID=1047168 RepID=A0A0F4GGT5_9PEZI|nr:hypothetical protein TI39_contig623g00012 [Zymoseptoria brevis]
MRHHYLLRELTQANNGDVLRLITEFIPTLHLKFQFLDAVDAAVGAISQFVLRAHSLLLSINNALIYIPYLFALDDRASSDAEVTIWTTMNGSHDVYRVSKTDGGQFGKLVEGLMQKKLHIGGLLQLLEPGQETALMRIAWSDVRKPPIDDQRRKAPRDAIGTRCSDEDKTFQFATFASTMANDNIPNVAYKLRLVNHLNATRFSKKYFDSNHFKQDLRPFAEQCYIFLRPQGLREMIATPFGREFLFKAGNIFF